MDLIIDINDMNEKCHPTYSDNSTFEACAREAELIDFKLLVGDASYIEVKGKMYDDEFSILMNGGNYTDNCGHLRYFGGLKMALAHLTYSRILKSSTLTPTRFGVTEKTESYSVRAELEERQRVSNDIQSVGSTLMAECVNYMYSSGLFDNLPP